MTSTPVLNFVIPVRHHLTVEDWDAVVARMAHTFASLTAQTSDRWTATVVANTGTPLPPTSQRFRVVRVDLPPAMLPEQRRELARFYAAVRTDKGKRVLAGLRHGEPADFAMVLDFDDLLHRDLVRFVEQSPGANGWYLGSGYVFDGSRLLLLCSSNFHLMCGSSHIVPSDAYRTAGNAGPIDDAYVQRALGSHIFIKDDLAAAGRPLAPLPFPGAVYRIGHAGNTSGSGSIARTFFRPTSSVRHPIRMLRRLGSLRTMDRGLEIDYFAGSWRGRF